MISALKQGIAIYANDPAWAKVRPPLVELTARVGQDARRWNSNDLFTLPGLKRSGRNALTSGGELPRQPR